MAEDASTTAKSGATGLWQNDLMNPAQLLTLGAALYNTAKIGLSMMSKRVTQFNSKETEEGTKVEATEPVTSAARSS